MSEIDRVFARFHDEKAPTTTDRREVRSIPQRGTGGSRTVEVVHVRSGATARPSAQSRPSSFGVRAEAWDDGFPAQSARAPSPYPEPVATVTVEPVAHVMPRWESAAVAVESVPSIAEEGPAAQPPKRTRQAAPLASRHFADPFDAKDDGANCLRCGYAIEPVREHRGLMTCGECG